ncbi:MAG: hypothetical protein PHQ43_08255 [Dehalococcoidales bacterium]|nr:hypothetical protein [Dehalococcoidales bacterium]
MSIELTYKLARYRGEKLLEQKSGKAHSFVQAWLILMFIHMTSINRTIRDTGGVNRTAVEYETSFEAEGTTSNSMGIVFGTGIAAVTVADYQLAAPIGSGSLAGQMQYCLSTITQPSANALGSTITHHRRAFNKSGGAITVAEWGLHARFRDSGGATRYMLAARDVLAIPMTIEDDEIIEGSYSISTGIY